MTCRPVLLPIALVVVFCVGCSPKSQDLNRHAALTGTLPYPVLEWKVITTSSDRAQKTMSTLFGNDSAVQAVRSSQPYPAGATLALVTWRAQNNPNWFGSRVPGDPLRIESVEFTGSDRRYRVFSEPGAKEQNPSDAADRVELLCSMKAVPLP